MCEKSVEMRLLRIFSYQEEAELAPPRAAGVAPGGKNEGSASTGGGLDV